MIGYLFQEVASVGEFHVNNFFILHSLIITSENRKQDFFTKYGRKKWAALFNGHAHFVWGFILVLFVFSILSERWGKNHMDVFIYF